MHITRTNNKVSFFNNIFKHVYYVKISKDTLSTKDLCSTKQLSIITWTLLQANPMLGILEFTFLWSFRILTNHFDQFIGPPRWLSVTTFSTRSPLQYFCPNRWGHIFECKSKSKTFFFSSTFGRRGGPLPVDRGSGHLNIGYSRRHSNSV